tara:strand:+ start:10235 stop:10600 length:366 start_codon:yes stop_codon:yes gene_type:complete
MRQIKQEEKKPLTLKCVDLISKTLVELGQTKSEQEIVILAQSLSNDLFRNFSNLMFIDIENAFSNGVRNTDLFALNVKTYYRWIKIWRQIIWDARHEVDVNGADPKAIPNYRPEPKLLTNK